MLFTFRHVFLTVSLTTNAETFSDLMLLMWHPVMLFTIRFTMSPTYCQKNRMCCSHYGCVPIYSDLGSLKENIRRAPVCMTRENNWTDAWFKRLCRRKSDRCPNLPTQPMLIHTLVTDSCVGMLGYLSGFLQHYLLKAELVHIWWVFLICCALTWYCLVAEN